MQRRKQNMKKTCPHKLHKLSLDAKLRPSPKQLLTSKSPQKLLARRTEAQLVLENQQLREQNNFYQQYFGTFEIRYKQQKRENKRLKRQIESLSQKLSKEKENYSSNKRCQTGFSTSEKTITNKLSRATKCSRGTFTYE